MKLLHSEPLSALHPFMNVFSDHLHHYPVICLTSKNYIHSGKWGYNPLLIVTKNNLSLMHRIFFRVSCCNVLLKVMGYCHNCTGIQKMVSERVFCRVWIYTPREKNGNNNHSLTQTTQEPCYLMTRFGLTWNISHTGTYYFESSCMHFFASSIPWEYYYTKCGLASLAVSYSWYTTVFLRKYRQFCFSMWWCRHLFPVQVKPTIFLKGSTLVPVLTKMSSAGCSVFSS